MQVGIYDQPSEPPMDWDDTTCRKCTADPCECCHECGADPMQPCEIWCGMGVPEGMEPEQ